MKTCSTIRPVLFVAALTLFSSGLLHAHAVVTHTTLSSSHITPFTAEQVHLSFNSRVELDLSQILLVSQGDKMQPLKAVQGDKPGQIVIDLPPLAPGEYAIKLKIFAADGHLSDDLVHFFVMPVNEK